MLFIIVFYINFVVVLPGFYFIYLQFQIMKPYLIKVLSLFLTGLIAGTFFYGSFCVLPAFYELPSVSHLSFRTTLMNHNKVIVMALVIIAIPILMMYCWEVRKSKIARILCLFTLIFTIVSLVVTRLGSVPINIEMKKWNPASPPADWLLILDKWDLYNAIRTFTSIAGFICLLIADVRFKKIRQTKVSPASL